MLGHMWHVTNICHLELTNLLTKHTLLVIKMCLIFQEIRVQVQVLKLWKSI